MNMRGVRTVLLVAIGLSVAASVGAQSVDGARSSAQLVIPFDNARREAQLYWLSEGSAVLLTDELIARGVEAVSRDDRLLAFERLRVPPIAALSYATIIRLARLVGAARVIVGSFELEGEQLAVHARVVQLDTGQISPELVERGPLTAMFEVYSRMARALEPGTREVIRPESPPPAAFEQYVKGMLAENPATQVAFLTRALATDRRFERARIALWSAHTELAAHQRALDVARQVPADHPLGRRAKFLSAVSLLHLGRYREAYDTLVELNQSKADPVLLNALGVVQLRRGSSGGASAASFFSDAVASGGGDPDMFFNLGYASWLDRDTMAAIRGLREAVRRNPADHEAHYVLGVVLQAAGNDVEAARERGLARQLSSVYGEWDARKGSDPVPRGLERLLTRLDTGDSRRLEATLMEVGRRDQREQATFHLESGRRLFQLGLDAEAGDELRRAVYLAPYQSEAHLLLGRIYLRSGLPREAVDALKISVWSEDTLEAHLVLAEAYLAIKDELAARSEIAIVLARDPQSDEAHRLLSGLAR